MLSSRFCDEKLSFRRNRGHGDVKHVEKGSKASSFVTIGQELPEICSFKSCRHRADIGVGASENPQFGVRTM